MKNDGPCYNCPDRKVGKDADCHVICEKYKTFRKEWNENRAGIIRENEKKAGLDALFVKKALDAKKKWRSK